MFKYNLTGGFDIILYIIYNNIFFRVSLVNKELQVLLVTVDPLDLLGPLD